MKVAMKVLLLYFAGIQLSCVIWAIVAKMAAINFGNSVVADNLILLPVALVSIFLSQKGSGLWRNISVIFGVILLLYLFQFSFDLYINPPQIDYAEFYPPSESWKYQRDLIVGQFERTSPFPWCVGGLVGLLIGRVFKTSESLVNV